MNWSFLLGWVSAGATIALWSLCRAVFRAILRHEREKGREEGRQEARDRG